MADRENASRPTTSVVRPWADRNQVAILIPIARNKQVRLSAERAWKNESVEAIKGSDKPAFFHAERATWTTARGATPHALIHFYLSDDPRSAESGDEEGVYLVSGKHVVSFYANVMPDAASAWALFLRYRHRWSQENLHKRHHAFVGRSDSSDMLPRDRQYHLGMLALAAYGLWRLHRRLGLGLSSKKAIKSRFLTHTRFLQDAARQLERRILRRATGA